MPKLPILSGSEVVRVLVKLGFEPVRQRGSHLVMRSPSPEGARVCVVPLHHEVQVGTLAGVLRQAGLTPEEFLAKL